jgi:hypothetical protein
MPTPFADHSGKRFSHWAVMSFAGRDKSNKPLWMCKCDCGVEKVVTIGSLQQGRSKSCGCKGREIRAQKSTKHGMASTPTYKSWHAMLQRTEGKGGHASYPLRGIGVCAEWHSFDNFFADMGVRPEGKTLDRIDNSKGYSKENCRWATPKEQMNNRDTNRVIEYKGIRKTITEIGSQFGINVNTMRGRLRQGWTIEKTIEKPVTKKQARGI